VAGPKRVFSRRELVARSAALGLSFPLVEAMMGEREVYAAGGTARQCAFPSYKPNVDRALIDWLKEQNPDNWHRVAISWNWDWGFFVLVWIVSQPDCDKATAQHLFVLTNPDYFLRFRTRDAMLGSERVNIEGFDFLKLLAGRWSEGVYRRSEIATMDDLLKVQSYRQAYRETEAPYKDRLPWVVNDEIFEVFKGRVIDASDYQEGIPPELQRRGVKWIGGGDVPIQCLQYER